MWSKKEVLTTSWEGICQAMIDKKVISSTYRADDSSYEKGSRAIYTGVIMSLTDE